VNNKSKTKGNQFEADAVKILNTKILNCKFKRIPSSGAIGTAMDEPLLTGDLTGKVDSISKKFKGECKIGYNNSTNKGTKQFTLKKEWLDKIIKEAASNFSIPFLIGKFSGVHSGVSVFVVLDVDTFAELINTISRMNEKLEAIHE
jgi:hypothetical protein